MNAVIKSDSKIFSCANTRIKNKGKSDMHMRTNNKLGSQKDFGHEQTDKLIRIYFCFFIQQIYIAGLEVSCAEEFKPTCFV